MWNVDAGYNNATGALNAEKWRGYKNVPIIYSNRGYTLFFNSFYSGRLDIGYTNSKKCTMNFKVLILIFLYGQGLQKKIFRVTQVLREHQLFSLSGDTDIWREVIQHFGRHMVVRQSVLF